MNLWIVQDGYRDDGLVERGWIKTLSSDEGEFVMQFDTHMLPLRGVLRRIAAEHNACEGFNPAAMRELAEHCLKEQICYDAWEDELDGIIERLRT